MSLSIYFTNLVFAVTIQSAPAVDGPWSNRGASVNPCASVHSVSVNKTQPIEFFRIVPLDNGLAPTPGRPEFYLDGHKVRLLVPTIYQCPSSAILRYHWSRNGKPIAITTEPALADPAPAGFHLYQVQAETAAGLGWLSDYTSVLR